jgi:hypothetical protein
MSGKLLRLPKPDWAQIGDCRDERRPLQNEQSGRLAIPAHIGESPGIAFAWIMQDEAY